MVSESFRDALYYRSVEIILENQDRQGGYVASPNFPTYHFCWFRDSSFIAYAMDLAGEHDSAARFHDWAARQINLRAGVVERAVEKTRAGNPIEGADYLHTRYTLAGLEETGASEAWPNFQLDGFGTWLWSLQEHSRLNHGPLPESWLEAASLAARYLSALWDHPCYDCWEEFPEQVHPHTLAAVYGGLQAHTKLTGADHTLTLAAIRTCLLEDYLHGDHFVKFSGQAAVDASLLGLATPYGVVAPDDPRMRATVAAIETTLSSGGGLRRYAADTYYGGGEWILLTAWLGWYYTCLPGEHARTQALKALEWVRAQAGPLGFLAEQVPASLNAPGYFATWVEKWGPIANPLLWSHAAYIILVESLHK